MLTPLPCLDLPGYFIPRLEIIGVIETDTCHFVIVSIFIYCVLPLFVISKHISIHNHYQQHTKAELEQAVLVCA